MAGIHNALVGASGPSNFLFAISSNQTNANLRTLAVNAGWDQNSRVVATISSGVYISSNGTGTPALTVNGAFPGGVELINNGFIVGMGGNGGRGSDNWSSGSQGASSGAAGGLALSVSSAITINNASGTIAGGGGGGGGGSTNGFDQYNAAGAGGGGGGGRSSAAANSSGGQPGRSQAPVANAQPGASGTVNAAGSGGNGGLNNGGSGGSGGNWGVAGSGGQNTGGYILGPAGAGGSGGAAISGNSNITWTAFGTRLGGIS